MTEDSPRRRLGRQLALTRRAAGYNQYQFAAKLKCYSRSTVSNAETGHPDVARNFWVACDKALGSGGYFTQAFNEIYADEHQDRPPAQFVVVNNEDIWKSIWRVMVMAADIEDRRPPRPRRY